MFQRAEDLEVPEHALSVKLEDISQDLAQSELKVQTCIAGPTFEWIFSLNDKDSSEGKHKEVLCKLKLDKNLTSGQDQQSTMKL